MKKILSLTLALVMLMTCLAGISFAADPIAKVTTGDKTVEVATREELVAAISPRGTSVVTLLQDITADAVSDIPVCTIDLNGHTWKTTKGNVLAIQNEKTDDDAENFYSVVKNGTLHGASSAIRHEVGGLKVVNCTLRGDGSSAIQILDLTSNGAYNDGNIVEDSTLICTVKIGALAYNKKNLDQSKLSYTIKNSNILNTEGSGYQPLSRASGNKPGSFILDKNVSLYSYMTGEKDYAGSDISIVAGNITKTAAQSVEVLGKSYTGLTMWSTGDAAAPAQPEKPVEPEKPAVPETPAAPADPAAVIATVTTGDKTVEVTTREELAAAISPRGTSVVTLLQDITAPAVTDIPVCTIDLNGHTWKTTAGNVLAIQDEKTDDDAENFYTVIKNGTLHGATSAIRHEFGGLKISKCVLRGDGSSAIQILDLTSEGKYNDGNVVEDSTLICTVGIGALSYNKKNMDQSKLSYTIKKSSILNTVSSGYQPLSKAVGNISGTFVLDEDVNLYSYKTGSGDYASADLTVAGADLSKATATQAVNVLGEEYTGLTMWTTSDLGGGGTAVESVNDTEENVNYTHPVSGQVTKTTLKNAAEMVNANGGGTITLLEDVMAGGNGSINGSKCGIVLTVGATIDLGGHTLSSTVYNAIGINAPGQTVVVKNGSIYQTRESFNIRLVAGYLEMDNVKAYSPSGANVAIYSAENEKANIITNCTLVSETWFSVGYRPESSSGILQHNLNTIVKNCTVVSGSDVVFAAHQRENKITLEGENHLYVSGKKHWICDADEVPCVQVVINAAMAIADEKASLSVTIGGNDHTYNNLKYFKVEPLAAGIDLTKPEAAYGKDLETIQKALVETAYGFFNKSEYTVYSSDRLSNYATGISNQILSSTYMSPEELAPDNTYYFNCGRILHNIYAEALDGFDLGGSARNVMTNVMLCAQSIDSPMVIDKWTDYSVPADQVDASRKAWVQKWYDNFDQLQPGDLIVLLQGGGNYSNGSAGHLMMYLGQREGVEGGVLLSNTDLIMNVRENMFNPANAQTGTWNLYKPDNTVDDGGTVLGDIEQLAILRPLNDPYLLNAYMNGGVSAVLTNSAEARLANDGIELMLTIKDLAEFASLEPGKTYTLNLEITNNSNNAGWDAEHALYMNGEKMKEAGKVSLVGKNQVKGEASNYALIPYTLTVPATAKQGDKIVITGDVNGLPTRSFTFTVSGKKIDVKVTKAGDLEKPGTAGAFVNQFYQEIFGIELKLPITSNGLKQELFKPINNKYLAPKEQSKLYDMVLPEHFIGGDVILHHPSIAPHFPYANHVTKFHEDSYEVGDIFIGVKAKVERTQNPNTGVYSTKLVGYSDVAYIYLGSGKVAEATKTGYAVRPFDMLIDNLNYQADRVSGTGGQADTQWLVVLRPSLTLESLAPAPVVETPETPADPTTPETPTEPTAPTAPVEEKGAPVGLIIGIVAAVAVIAAVIVIVSKKKKK